MTTHERARELAAIAVDFELDDVERRELEDHLSGCEACRAHATGLAADAAGLAGLPGVDAPERVRRSVVAGRGLPAWARLGPTVAALALVVATGLPLAAGVLFFQGFGSGAGQGTGAPVVTPAAAPVTAAPTSSPEPSQTPSPAPSSTGTP